MQRRQRDLRQRRDRLGDGDQGTPRPAPGAGDFARFITDQIALNGFRVLAIELAHALHVHGLADHHRDPFDRILVAQSLVEGMPILSRDEQIAAYGVELVW